MTHPDLGRELEELLPCSNPVEPPHILCLRREMCDNCLVRPAILAYVQRKLDEAKAEGANEERSLHWAQNHADSELLAKARVAALRYAECPVNADDRPESWDRLSAMMDALGVDPNTSPRDAREALRKLVGEES